MDGHRDTIDLVEVRKSSVMQPLKTEPPTLSYEPAPPPTKGSLRTALQLVIPVGVLAGLVTFGAAIRPDGSGYVALVLFSILSPIIVCRMTNRWWLVLGIVVNVVFCVSVFVPAFILNAHRGGITYALGHAMLYAKILVVSCTISLVPSMLVALSRRPAA